MFHCMDLFTHSSVDGQLGCFCLLAIVNDAAVNTGIRSQFLTKVVHSYFSNLSSLHVPLFLILLDICAFEIIVT